MSTTARRGLWTLGLGGSDHDSSAALMLDGDIRVAIEQERITRRKHGVSHFFENPVAGAVEYCLDTCGITLEDVSRAVSSDLLPQKVRFELLPRDIRLYPHHLCHAASACMLLPPESTAAVLVYDGMGSIRGRTSDRPVRNIRETFSFYLLSRDGLRLLGQTTGTGIFEHDDFPSSVNNSLGMLYELITAALGFGVLESGKTMGLAAYGRPVHAELIEEFITYGSEPGACFECRVDDPALRTTIEGVLRARRGSFEVKANLAASIQAIVNKTLVHCIGMFAGHTFQYICIVGGCALNTVANSYLVDHSPFDVPVIVPPHAGDAGLALGALWLSAPGAPETLTIRGSPLHPKIARPGRTYTTADVAAAAASFYPHVYVDTSVATAHDIARELNCGSVIGFFSGGSEIGPRALGGRSILASPRTATTRERINRELKFREPFRPLAPIIPEERFGDFFTDVRHADPFMLKVAYANDRCRRESPAVVHVDGSARAQVVSKDSEPLLHAIATALGDIEGTPIVLNTSFNRRGEPIVETPLDAFDAFVNMKLDGLFIEGAFYRRSP